MLTLQFFNWKFLHIKNKQFSPSNPDPSTAQNKIHRVSLRNLFRFRSARTFSYAERHKNAETRGKCVLRRRRCIFYSLNHTFKTPPLLLTDDTVGSHSETGVPLSYNKYTHSAARQLLKNGTSRSWEIYCVFIKIYGEWDLLPFVTSSWILYLAI